jgi:hypothetical protein
MLFAGLGILIYASVALGGTAIAGFSGAHVAFGLQFAFVASLSVFFAAVILSYANRLLREHLSSVDRASAWRGRIVVTALVFFTGGVAILVAAAREPGDASIVSPSQSRAALVRRESARALAAERTLFQERGCLGCHRPDATGVGPTLHGVFGSMVQDPECGMAMVDESYLREAF